MKQAFFEPQLMKVPPCETYASVQSERPGHLTRLLLFLLTTVLLVGCNSAPTTSSEGNLEGDLFFSWLKMGSFYGHPDSFYTNYLENREQVLINANPEIKAIHSILEKHELLKSPFVNLRIDSTQVIAVYLNEEDYKQFTRFSYAELIANEQKVYVSLKAQKIGNHMYLSEKVYSVKTVSGQTLAKQTKFMIEDYK